MSVSRPVPRSRLRPVGVCCALACALLSLLVLPQPSSAQPSDDHRPAYRLPVDGAVLRGFASPATTFGSGHRGVDLDAAPGTRIVAAAAGTIGFAGDVAGTAWVTLAHADGVVTSYGPLTDLRVRAGASVPGGAPLGVLAAGGHGAARQDQGLHWGARHAGVYIDPLGLVDGLPRPSLIGPGEWQVVEHAVVGYEPWRGARLGGALVAPSPDADRPGYAVAPSPNRLVLLAGLGTRSDSGIIDPSHLGYDPSAVTAFSYAGLAESDGLAIDPLRDHQPYGPTDTWRGVPAAAALLEEQLRAQARREPGRAVDLVGHSMGGVVAVYYLTHLHDPYDPGLPQVGAVVTLGSPLRGSHVASIVSDLRDHSVLGPLLRRGHGALDQDAEGRARLSLDAPAIDQLAVGSELLDDLALGWDRLLGDGATGAAATGTRVLTVAGSSDLAVVADRARLPDLADGMLDGHLDVARAHAQARDAGSTPFPAEEISAHRVLPGSHGGLLRTEAVHETVWRFLAGEEVVDSPGHVSTIVGREGGDTASAGVAIARTLDRVGAPIRAVVGPPLAGWPAWCSDQPWCG